MKKNLIHFILSTALVLPTLTIANIEVGDYELYEKPNYTKNGFCDIGTKLTLDNGNLHSNIAFLDNFVSGSCEIYVSPSPRYYFLVQISEDNCGSTTYKGRNPGRDTITLTDNRNRFCNDNIPAKLEVDELRYNQENGKVLKSKLYSYDNR